jgi:hypothetical protein
MLPSRSNFLKRGHIRPTPGHLATLLRCLGRPSLLRNVLPYSRVSFHWFFFAGRRDKGPGLAKLWQDF